MFLLLVEVMRHLKTIKMETKRKMIKMGRVILEGIQVIVQALATIVLLGFLSTVALVGIVMFPLQEQVRRLKKREKRWQRLQR
ncbi:MAG: hypothetical protein EB037_07355 [Actinobacteria bacterium]|nr:hypothetical protein [Actinomycetota bacterium]